MQKKGQISVYGEKKKSGMEPGQLRASEQEGENNFGLQCFFLIQARLFYLILQWFSENACMVSELQNSSGGQL